MRWWSEVEDGEQPVYWFSHAVENVMPCPYSSREMMQSLTSNLIPHCKSVRSYMNKRDALKDRQRQASKLGLLLLHF